MRTFASLSPRCSDIAQCELTTHFNQATTSANAFACDANRILRDVRQMGWRQPEAAQAWAKHGARGGPIAERTAGFWTDAWQRQTGFCKPRDQHAFHPIGTVAFYRWQPSAISLASSLSAVWRKGLCSLTNICFLAPILCSYCLAGFGLFAMRIEEESARHTSNTTPFPRHQWYAPFGRRAFIKKDCALISALEHTSSLRDFINSPGKSVRGLGEPRMAWRISSAEQLLMEYAASSSKDRL
jgi:hypothetical protein